VWSSSRIDPGPSFVQHIYINDLPLSTKAQIRLFADDINIAMSHIQADKLEKNMNTELINISNWMKLNKLSNNYNKTEFIVITNSKAKPNYVLKIDDKIISKNTSIRYLGIIIDDALHWKPQIHKVCSKVASGCWALYHLRQYINSKSLLKVYYSLIHTHLNYCISSWGNASISALSSLDKLQKRVFWNNNITFNNKRDHTKPFFWKLQILKIMFSDWK